MISKASDEDHSNSQFLIGADIEIFTASYFYFIPDFYVVLWIIISSEFREIKTNAF